MKNELGFKELSDALLIKTISMMVEFLDNNDHDFLQFIGGLSLLSSCKVEEVLQSKLKNIVKLKLQNNVLYNELEKLPDIFTDDSSLSKTNIKNFLCAELSHNILYKVAFFKKIEHQTKYNHWGVIYLYQYLLELDLNNFENWIKKTERYDLKIVFINMLSNSSLNANIGISNLDNSNMGILQAFYALSMYNLEPSSNTILYNHLESVDISSLLKTNFSNKNKCIICLTFIIRKYRLDLLDKLNSSNELNEDLDQLIKYGYEFSEKDLKTVSNDSLCFKMFQKIKDCDRRQNCMKAILESLFTKSNNPEVTILDTNINDSKLLGLICIELNSCEKLVKSFEKEVEKLSFPYTFCRLKSWETRVTYLFFSLIGIYVYKINKNEEFNNYIELFNSIKYEKQHYYDRAMSEFVEKMSSKKINYFSQIIFVD